MGFSKSNCQTLTKWGRCQQTSKYDGQWCSYHYFAANVDEFRHDDYYHRKIVLRLIQASHDILSETEIDALFRGRTRNDGRRTDLYTIL